MESNSWAPGCPPGSHLGKQTGDNTLRIRFEFTEKAEVNKVFSSAKVAIRDVQDGATIIFGGLGISDLTPTSLILALRDRGVRNLTPAHSHAPRLADCPDPGVMEVTADGLELREVAPGWSPVGFLGSDGCLTYREPRLQRDSPLGCGQRDSVFVELKGQEAI